VPGTPAHQGASVGAKRIVVVDDNRDAADTLALSLSLLGHEVRVSYDATEVVDLGAAWRPHMMFLDVGMPKINGFELARRLRGQPWAQDVLLIALTGWGKDEDRRQSFEAGFDHHLVKPAELSEIERLCRGGASATAVASEPSVRA
jgi:CheY-like chemotaxis protein